MTNKQHTPRGKQARFDKRMSFIAKCLNMKIADNVDLANEWYINNGAKDMSLSDALCAFGEWIACCHEEEADRCESLDSGMGECEVAADFHATRASEIRSAISSAAGQ